jgi:hypothetical protein
MMSRVPIAVSCAAFLLALSGGAGVLNSYTSAAVGQAPDEFTRERRPVPDQSFQVDVIVNGRTLAEYYARGRTYIEALEGAEYELRIRNPLPERVAVSLSVDGLNTIDARHTSALNASKWVIGPYETITIGGWQMSSERARRFYFTNERSSYGAKLGQTANLGVIAAVFFRERRAAPLPITPPRPIYRKDSDRERSPESSSNDSRAAGSAKQQRSEVSPMPNDDYAATGIGRSVENDVRWVNMDLRSQPTAEVTIRYEYYSALLRLGVIPDRYRGTDPLRRREQSKGFEDRRFSPEPQR